MAKNQSYRKAGQVDFYEPVKPKGPDFGEILGGIVVFVIFIGFLSQCSG